MSFGSEFGSAPMVHFAKRRSTGFESGRIVVIDFVFCAVLQTDQRPGVCIAVYGAVHYKEPFNTVDKSRA